MSFFELILILIVALLVIKPERLPEIAYALGCCLAKIRQFYQQFLHQKML